MLEHRTGLTLKRTTKMQTFHDFLAKIRPLINASEMEKTAGIPRNTLNKHYRYTDGKAYGQPCHPKYFSSIVRALCAVFGTIEIGGWRITCDPDGPAIFAVKAIPGLEAKLPAFLQRHGATQLAQLNMKKNLFLQPEWREKNDFINRLLDGERKM